MLWSLGARDTESHHTKSLTEIWPYLIDEISEKRNKLKTHKVFLHEKDQASEEVLILVDGVFNNFSGLEIKHDIIQLIKFVLAYSKWTTKLKIKKYIFNLVISTEKGAQKFLFCSCYKNKDIFEF